MGAEARLPRGQVALALAAGALAAFGHAPLAFWPATLIGLTAAAVLLLRQSAPRRAAWMGWLTGLGYFGVALSWIVEPFLVDIARHGWMAPLALGLMAAGLALFWAAAFALARWIAPGGGAAPALALTLPLAELARAYIFTGFPWAMPAYAFVGQAPAQLAALVGSHGVNVWLLAVVGLAAMAVGRRRWLPGGLAVALLALGFAVGPWTTPARGALPDRPVIRLVQPNAAQHLKWQRDMVHVFFDRQRAFTAAPPGPLGAPDLVVWPETAVPYMLSAAGPALAAVGADAQGAETVVGIQRRDAGGAYNSLAVIGTDGHVRAVYDKHHLVPFGEYFPGGPLARRLGLAGLAALDAQGYARGPGPELLDFGPLGTALPLICYEAIFPQDIHRAPERPDFLLQITNDAWFGTISGPYQHLDQARMRAIEQRLPLVRVANTGISAIIGIDGAVIDALPLGTAGYVDIALPPPGPIPFYARTGDTPLAILLIVLVLSTALTTRRKAH